MSNKKILLVGESWEIFSVHKKGFDSFFTNKYEEAADQLIDALQENGFEVDYLTNQKAAYEFPNDLEEINKYNVVILSDIGSNTLLLHPDTFEKSIPTTNRLKLLKKYVENGGGFLMIGGYLSFQGIEAKAQYKDTPVEEILPVNLQETDDRKEKPEGINPKIVKQHPVVDGLDEKWPMLLGYNDLSSKPNSKVLVSWEEDPILTIHKYKNGRTAAFASDCAPHWGSPEFVEWNHYNKFWGQLISWLSQ